MTKHLPIPTRTPSRTPTPSHLKRFSAGLLPRDMREICRTRNQIYYGGVAPDIFLKIVEQIRQDYISRVGLRRYILDMLPGSIAQMPANQCTAYGLDGSRITGTRQQKILGFLLANFATDDFPYRIDVRRANKNDTVENITFSL